MTAPRKVARPAAVVDEPVDDVSTEDTPVVGQNIDDLVAQLQAQMAAQQAQIAQLLAEKGIPADPKAAKIQALQDHLTFHASVHPNHKDVYAPALAYVNKLSSDTLTTNKAAKAANLVTALHDELPHELAYTKQLARELHTMTLDPEDEED